MVDLVGENGRAVGEEDGGEELAGAAAAATVIVAGAAPFLEVKYGFEILGSVGVPYVEALGKLQPGLHRARDGVGGRVPREAVVEDARAEDDGFAVVAEPAAGEAA